MANNFCQNCGSALVMQDGKLVCPTCGSVFAMNWDKDDVARAQEATKQERAQAWVDRMQQTSQARAAFQQQAQINDARRKQKQAMTPLLKMGMALGIMFIMYIFSSFAFRMIACNVSRSLKSATKTSATAATKVEDIRGIDTVKVVEDEEFLKNAVASGRYTIRTENKEYTAAKDKRGTLSGQPEFIDAYVLSSKDSSEIHMIFKAEYEFADSGETMDVYMDTYLANIRLDENGKVLSNYSAYLKSGDNCIDLGYADMETLVADVIESEKDKKITKLNLLDGLVKSLNEEA